MPDYFCRVTCSTDKLRPVFEKLSNHTIAYEHNEDSLNVHTHFFIKDMKESTDTLKNWIRKLVGPFKATEWSFKTKYKPHKEAQEVPVTDGCITYMSKGKLEPSYNRGFKPEYVEEYKLKWLDFKRSAKQQGLKQYLVKETQQNSKLRQNEMIDEIIIRIDKMREQKQDVFAEDILRLIRQVVIVENKTIIGRYKVRDYFDTINARENPQTWMISMRNYVSYKEN